jgi:hypothetical protein
MNRNRIAPQQKIANVAKRLGIPALANQQGSLRIIFDTSIIATSAQPQTISFFNNSQGKSNNFTNLKQGVLQAGEAVACDEFKFLLVNLSATNLALDTTTFNGVANTFEEAIDDIVAAGAGLSLIQSQMSLTIANDQVIKDVPVIDTYSPLNFYNQGVAIGSSTTLTDETIQLNRRGYSVLRNHQPPVIPPNQAVKLELRVPPISLSDSAVWAIVAYVGRTGSLFSAGTTL